ncbi:DUF3987 domain-containing protein [Chamaesiphon sp. VAR_48_metabat_135_sub]|uniref:DUF3987 domain-containing protein n=1 Tax=Chamaesiphon sp. VAR_48_metabat_135_sub TaxID=2964699 RepID=UPI00286CF4D1|nr:DUF3987 domain-containing protein [Chamaesiphon sp. VAR_48_metabat_135_sub]
MTDDYEIYDIRTHLNVLTKTKGSQTKYHCPVCNRRNLDIHPPTGAYKCFSGECDPKDIRLAIDQLEGKPEWKPVQAEWVKPIRPKAQTDYFYPDRDGNPLIKVVRSDDGEGNKKFPQFHWTGSNWKIGNPQEIRHRIPIYRLTEVRAAIGRGELIFWVEGENTADLLWKLGIAATTTLGGSDGYCRYGTYQADLAGARLVLTPDRDSNGLKYITNIKVDFANQIEGYYLAGTQGLWQNPQGGMDIGDDIRDHNLTKEQILAKVISPHKYGEIINLLSDLKLEEKEESQQLVQELSELLNKKSQIAPQIFAGRLGIEMAHTAANFNIPLEIFSACLLPILASQIGAKSRLMINPGTDYKAPPILWVGMVGESGTMKTPILNILTASLCVIQGELAEQWKLNKAERERELEYHQFKKKGEKTEPLMPLAPLRDIFFSDFTIESIAQSVSNYPDTGYLIFVDELAGFFKSMDAYRQSGGDRQKWLTAYNGGGFKVNRKGADTLWTSHTSLSMLGGVQPSVLEKLIKQDDSPEDGLWNRFMFVHLPQSKMAAFSIYSFGLADELKTIYQRLSNQPEREYKLADESKPVWKLWHDQMEEKVWNEPSNLLRATYAKFKGAAARIALVLHCTNAAIVNQLPDTPISSETLSDAIAFTQWLLNQTLLEYQRMGLLDNSKLNRIFKFIDRFDGRNWIDTQTVKAFWSTKIKPGVSELRLFMASVVALGYAIDNGFPPTSSKYQILITRKGSLSSPTFDQTSSLR